jgi:hypothetical protein
MVNIGTLNELEEIEFQNMRVGRISRDQSGKFA